MKTGQQRVLVLWYKRAPTLQDRLVGQGEDAAVVTSGSQGKVQVLIDGNFLHAKYVYWYTYQLNFVLTKIFFYHKNRMLFADAL